MRKVLLNSVSTLAIVIGSGNFSLAAENGSKDWSGFYVGATAGYGITDMDTLIHTSDVGDEVSQKSNNGLLTGLYAGYNWQFDKWVFGIEGDITKTGWSKSSVAPRPTASSGSFESNVEALASVRARVGFDVSAGTGLGMPMLVYGTAGVAFVNADYLAQDSDETTSGNFNGIGAVVGGGFETRITDNISLGLEGLYYIFNEKDSDLDVRLPSSGVAGDQAALDDIFVVRARLSYYFGGSNSSSARVLPASAGPSKGWSGFYVGANTGYGFTDMDSVIRNNQTANIVQQKSNDGFISGLHAGYNWQYGQWVFGVEGDITNAGWKKSSTGPGTSSNNSGLIESTVEALASVRARVGFDAGTAVGMPTLIYATGGVAFVEGDFLAEDSDEATSSSFNNVGAVVGGGFETRITDNISLGLEGLYYIFNKKYSDLDVRFSSSGAAGDKATLDDIFVVRARLSYYFGGSNNNSSGIYPASDKVTRDWSGFYFGANAGYGFTDMDTLVHTEDVGDELIQTSNNGFLTGLHAGYNWQYNRWVVGIEGDITMAGWNKVATGSSGVFESNVEALASVRARVGFDVSAGAGLGMPLLIYGTGGVAFVNADYLAQDSDESTSGNFNSVGAVIGAGFETRVTDNITVGVEGLYYIFNEKDSDFDVRLPSSGQAGEQAELENIIAVRARVSFNF